MSEERKGVAPALPLAHTLQLPSNRDVYEHLQWMLQKDELKQDMFLISDTGGAWSRRLAMGFCELVGRPYEYLNLSKDTTESDLKQRREVIDGSVVFADSAPVRAALHGHVLILDGVHRAERNVLPSLNNLLENREIALADGRFIVHPDRYDALLSPAQGYQSPSILKSNLVRAHEDFRVIALGLACPPNIGYPLDPPFRSRFQARNCSVPSPSSSSSSSTSLSPSLLSSPRALSLHTLESALSIAFNQEGRQKLPHLPQMYLERIERMASLFPAESVISLFARVYPYTLLHHDLSPSEVDSMKMVKSVVQQVERKQCDSQSSREEVYRSRTDMNLAGNVKGIAEEGHDPGACADQYTVYPLPESSTTASRSARPYCKPSSTDLDADNVTTSSIPSSPPSLFAATSPAHVRHFQFEEKRCNNPHIEKERPATQVYSVYGGSSATTLPLSLSSSSSVVLSRSTTSLPPAVLPIPSQLSLLSRLLQDAVAGYHPVLVGHPSSGKSFIAKQFAALLGYRQDEVQLLHCNKEQSTRDLLQRRNLDEHGCTSWENSPLLQACKEGHLCVLDGLHRLLPSTLASLSSLVMDGEVMAPDGTRYIPHHRYTLLKMHRGEEGSRSGDYHPITEGKVLPIHPSFRILGLAAPPSNENRWLQSDTMSMFNFHDIGRGLSREEAREIFEESSGSLSQALKNSLFGLAYPTPISEVSDSEEVVSNSGDIASLSSSRNSSAYPLDSSSSSTWPLGRLSLRQLLRVGRRALLYPDDIHECISRNVLVEFSPAEAREAFEDVMKEASILKKPTTEDLDIKQERQSPWMRVESVTEGSEEGKEVLRVWDGRDVVNYPVQAGSDRELIPQTVFYENPKHLRIIADILKDYQCGERNILLIGPQGTGKNKVTDHLLQSLRVEREYLQLHRDTTVSSLTLSPTLEDGIMKWEDSPLVKAAIHGRTIVIDEADKAPLEVVCVLKGLLEDGLLRLADGRRIIDERKYGSPQQSAAALPSSDVSLHKDFRVIVLCNKPSWPFHGNDFYREMGDCFSTHVLQNPDYDSEMALVAQHAPNVPFHVRRKLVETFTALRQVVDEGELAYPYSTRELVNVARHLAQYPRESIGRALGNVFDFDTFDSNVKEVLKKVSGDVGVQLDQSKEAKVQLAESATLEDGRDGQTTCEVAGEFRVEEGERVSSQDGSEKGRRQGGSITIPVLVDKISSRSASHLFLQEKDITTDIGQQQQQEIFTEVVNKVVLPSAATLFQSSRDSRSEMRLLPKVALGNSASDQVHILMQGHNSRLITLKMSPRTCHVDTATMVDLNFLPADCEAVLVKSRSKRDSVTSDRGNREVTRAEREGSDQCHDLLLFSRRQGILYRYDPFTKSAIQFHLPESFHGRPVRMHTPALSAMRDTRHLNSDLACTQGIVSMIRVDKQKDESFLLIADLIGERYLTAHFPGVTLRDCNWVRQDGSAMLLADSVGNTLLLKIPSLRGSRQNTNLSLSLSYLSFTPTSAYSELHRQGEGSPLPWTQYTQEEGRIGNGEGDERNDIVQAGRQSTRTLAEKNSYMLSPFVKERELSNVLQARHSNRLRVFQIRRATRLSFASSKDVDGTEGWGKATTSAEVKPTHTLSTCEVTLRTPQDTTNICALPRLGEVSDLSPLLHDCPWLECVSIENSSGVEKGISRQITCKRIPLTLFQKSSKVISLTSFRQHAVALLDDGTMAFVMFNDKHILEERKNWFSEMGYEDHEEGGEDGSGQENTSLHDVQMVESGLQKEWKVSILNVAPLLNVDTADLEQMVMDMGGSVLEGTATIGYDAFGANGAYGEADAVGGDGGSRGGGIGNAGGGGAGGGGGVGGGGSGTGGGGGPGSSRATDGWGGYRPNEMTILTSEQTEALLKQISERAERELVKARSLMSKDEKQSENDTTYERIVSVVRSQIQQLRVELQSVEAKSRERQWLHHQLDGELDDSMLVDGVAGERKIFRKVGKAEKQVGIQHLPKRICFAVDISNSMSRGNSWDGRLDREAQAIVMVMEAFEGLEDRFMYSLIGHGGGGVIELCPFASHRRTAAEKNDIIERMYSISRGSPSGDTSMAAIQKCVKLVTEELADDYLVIALTDGRYGRHGITSDVLSRCLTADSRVNCTIIFIAEPGAAAMLSKGLTAGKALVCMNPAHLPAQLKQVIQKSAMEEEVNSFQ